MIEMLAKTATMCLVWCVLHFVFFKQDSRRSFCAGFCIAQAISELCGRCAWLYSVVFGELLGFFMLVLTVSGSGMLFNMLSEDRRISLLTAFYFIFSSGMGEYTASDATIINTAARGVSYGVISSLEDKLKGFVLMLVCCAGGQLIAIVGGNMPASFGAIACSALLCRGMWGTDGNTDVKLCCAGAVTACLLNYF